MARSRLFVAVTPPAEVVAAVAALPRSDEPGVRWTRPGTWHVTLRFLGAAVDEHEALVGFDSLVARPAVAEVGPAVIRLGRNIVCVPVAGLEALAGAVRRATAAVGEPPEDRGFFGHITLARLVRRTSCALIGAPCHAVFSVDRVELVRSTLSSAGPSYEVLAERRLAG